LKSPDGDVFIPAPQLKMFTSTDEIGPVDWVVIAVKSTSLVEVPPLVKPLLKTDSSTGILAIMNGLIDEDLASLLVQHKYSEQTSKEYPFSTIYGGMAFLCSNRVNPGEIVHSYAGLLGGGISLSSQGKTIQEDLEELSDLWKPTKVEFVPETSLTAARWVKNIWNLPFNGISVAMGGITIDKVCSNPDLRNLAEAIMDETILIASADIDSRGGNSTIYPWKEYVSNQHNKFEFLPQG